MPYDKTRKLIVLGLSTFFLFACGKHSSENTKRSKLYEEQNQSKTTEVESTKIDESKQEEEETGLKIIEEPEEKTVYFTKDSAEVNVQYQDIIEDHVQFLKSHPDKTVHLLGYADKTGSKKYNQKLSQKRAHSVAQLLLNEGIQPKQIVISAMGAVESEQNLEENRRVEFQYDQLYTLSE